MASPHAAGVAALIVKADPTDEVDVHLDRDGTGTVRIGDEPVRPDGR